MPSAYPQRALTVLLLFGTLSAAMALLSSSLIFQLPSGRAAPGAGAGAGGRRGALPEPVAAALLPVSAVLAALCLVLNVSCLLLCLLHGYCSTELCRGQRGPERADWFLLDSRSVRHAAIGLFCCGLCLYLTALALFMLLLFELEAGIASACILTSGILVLLISVLHALLRASQISQTSCISRGSEPSQALYENDSAQPGDSGDKTPAAPARPRLDIQREFSFPPCLEGKSRPGSASSSKEFQQEFQQECQDWPRNKEFPKESQFQDWSRSKEFTREFQQECQDLSRSKEFTWESQIQDWSRSKEFPRECQDWSRNMEFIRESQFQDWSRSKELPRESQIQDLLRSKEFPGSRSKEFQQECQDSSRSKEFPRESQIQDSSRSKEFSRESQFQDSSRNKEFPKESQFQDSSRNKEFPRKSQFQDSSRNKEFPRKSQFQAWSRSHRTLDSLLDWGLLQEQGKPWNVLTREMRKVMSHKTTAKDSTLV